MLEMNYEEVLGEITMEVVDEETDGLVSNLDEAISTALGGNVDNVIDNIYSRIEDEVNALHIELRDAVEIVDNANEVVSDEHVWAGADNPSDMLIIQASETLNAELSKECEDELSGRIEDLMEELDEYIEEVEEEDTQGQEDKEATLAELFYVQDELSRLVN